jgi:hypothetical protein
VHRLRYQADAKGGAYPADGFETRVGVRTKGAVQSLTMKIAQSNISQMEKRPDSLISTLSQYIEALGGKLEIHAKFPDGQDVEIKQFG